MVRSAVRSAVAAVALALGLSGAVLAPATGQQPGTALPAAPAAPPVTTAAAPAVVPADWSTQPAEDAAVRLLGPELAAQVRFVAEEPTADGVDHYRITAEGGQIVVGGTTPAVQLRGLNTYLGDVAGMNISWTGEQLGEELPLPTEEIFQTANVEHRFALNDTDDGYTGPYRTWEDWEPLIDVLALHGINEVFLSVGTEAVYLDTFQEFGYTEAELLSWIPQPAHQPWWLLQNMQSFPSAVSRQLVEERAELGRQIADRLRELGITPVLPGYFGTVPDGFAAKNPGARTVPQGGWVGFDRPDWLDPTGPVFDEVAAAFYEHSEERLGASDMYKMDLLHEGGTAGPVNVPDASRAVETALREAHPDAIWAILGWQSNPRPQTIQAVDRAKMLIVDGLSDRHGGLNRESSWSGTPYAFGSIWNFGGHTTMGANTRVWNQRYFEWLGKSDSALNGIAVLPEAVENNPVAFDLITALPWQDGPQDMDAAFADWAERRYGAEDEAAVRAWQTLGQTAYAMPADNWSEAQDGLFGARPSLTTTTAAAWSPTEMRYDPAAFARALPALLDVAPELRDSSAYRYDLMDVARQVLSNHSRTLLPQIRSAFESGDAAALEDLTEQWLTAMDLLDEVTGTNEMTMLGPWLADARAWGADEAEADRLEYDARILLSEWGHRSAADSGRLRDYANREWSGLISTYYKPRWELFLTELADALEEDRNPQAIDWFAYGDAWARGTDPLPTEPSGDIHEIAGDVVDFLSAQAAPLTVTATAEPAAVTADEPAVVTVRVRNDNPFTDATDLAVELEDRPGIAVTELEAPASMSLAAGEEAVARYEVTLTDGGELSSAVVGLEAVARYTLAGEDEESRATVRLMAADGVEPPNLTVNRNAAQFAQVGDSYAIIGGGADLWGQTNEYGAIYREDVLVPDTAVTTQVLSQERTGPWARAGIIVGQDLTAPGGVGFANLALTPDHGCVLSWDDNGDGRLDSTVNDSSFSGSAHLRLSRDEDRLIGECSTDGETWTQVGAVETGTDAPLDAGLFMTAAGPGRGLVELEGFEITSASGLDAPGPGTHYLSDLPFLSSTGEHGPWERDMHNGETAAGDGGPIRLAGVEYAKGLGTNSNAEAEFYLGGQCTRFESLVGIDDSMDRDDAEGDVTVEVWADDELVYESDVIRAGEQPRVVDVDVTDAEVLRLVVDQYDEDNWWDRTNWADARVTCGEVEEPTEEPTTEEPTSEEPTSEEPTTEEPTREEPTTEEPTSEEPTSEVPTSEEPTTEAPTTEVPTTEDPTTEEPSATVGPTAVPTTDGPTAGGPSSPGSGVGAGETGPAEDRLPSTGAEFGGAVLGGGLLLLAGVATTLAARRRALSA